MRGFKDIRIFWVFIMQIWLDREEKRPYNRPIGRRQQPVGARRFCAEEGRTCFSFFLLFIEKGVLGGALLRGMSVFSLLT